MRIKELSTLIGAGILSLAAVMVLETGGSGTSEAEPIPATDFEDTSSLIEYSYPAPTAEPPAKGEGKNEAGSTSVVESGETSAAAEAASKVKEMLTGSSDGSEPAPENGEKVGTPVVAGVTEPLEAPASEEDSPVDLPESATTAPATPGTTETTPEKTTTGGGLSDDFMKAVAAATDKATETVTGNTDSAGDGAEQPSIIEETPDGFWLKSAKLNDVFQHLAQLANMQYFHNTEIDAPNFVVTGQLMNDDPVKQMEELALMYGITIHQKGNTVYALNSAQLSQLPTEPFRYQLKYLRPKDIDQIKLILQPFLTPGSGIIEYETKTNTLIVMDNSRKLDALAVFLDQIDQPKQQVAIETRILRVTSSSRNRIGVDWSTILGDGLPISGAGSLNNLFNLPELETVTQVLTTTGTGATLGLVKNNLNYDFSEERTTGYDDAGLVLSPVQMTAVLRALNAGGLAEQESSPTLIAEDNEEGLISIIDRIPIITSTVTITDGSQNVTEEVRYKIDEDDPAGNPTDTREVGVSVAVTPTILPDNTIRMSLRPRSSQVVDYIEGKTGNLYPRVNESTVTTTARVPNGYSLLIGGFYEEITADKTNKVPVLGDIPAVNLLFKSTDKEKELTSLVFIVTPKLYRPNVAMENDQISHEIHESHILPTNHDYPDPDNPGFNHRSNLRNTLNNSFKRYEPDAPSNLLLPNHPYNRPESLPVLGRDDRSEPQFAQGDSPEVTVRPVDESRKNSGLLGRMFGGHKKTQAP
jgi:type II secretory pathway component GspD/PulD (secretin)